jgi:hypothetical protein
MPLSVCSEFSVCMSNSFPKSISKFPIAAMCQRRCGCLSDCLNWESRMGWYFYCMIAENTHPLIAGGSVRNNLNVSRKRQTLQGWNNNNKGRKKRAREFVLVADGWGISSYTKHFLVPASPHHWNLIESWQVLLIICFYVYVGSGSWIHLVSHQKPLRLLTFAIPTQKGGWQPAIPKLSSIKMVVAQEDIFKIGKTLVPSLTSLTSSCSY